MSTSVPLHPAAVREWESLPEPIRRILPVEDAWALIPEIRYETWAREEERRARLSRILLDPRAGRKRDAFKTACMHDPLFFYRNCIWTRDPECTDPTLPKELPFIPFSYAIREWLLPWERASQNRTYRQIDEKTRRLIYTISRMAFEMRQFRLQPGRLAWVASASDLAIDNGDNWNSLFGKFRFFWRRAREAFPWFFPDLPPSTEVNKKEHILFPDWEEGGDRPCWGNTLSGFLPSEVAGRGGGYTNGWIDEAAWIDALGAYMDSIHYATPVLTMGSTARAMSEHPFVQRRNGVVVGYEVHTVWWGMDPTKARGIYWDDKATEFNSPVAKWRSPWFHAQADGMDHASVAQNLGLDYSMAGSSKVFISFQRKKSLGSLDPLQPTYDLYNPSLPLILWYDVGYSDPHALWWVQTSEATGEVNLVGYWMIDNVSPHYLVPVMGAWDPDEMDRWKTQPEWLKWKDVVPWPYSAELQAEMRYWRGKKQPKHIIADIYGKGRRGESQFTVEDRFRAYGFKVFSASPAHHLDDWIKHANEIMPRIRISGRIVGKRPEKRFPPPEEIFTSWQYLPTTLAGRQAIPQHDVYSHGGSAIVYGCQQLPSKQLGRLDKPDGRRYSVVPKASHMQMGPALDRDTGWL